MQEAWTLGERGMNEGHTPVYVLPPLTRVRLEGAEVKNWGGGGWLPPAGGDREASMKAVRGWLCHGGRGWGSDRHWLWETPLPAKAPVGAVWTDRWSGGGGAFGILLRVSCRAL